MLTKKKKEEYINNELNSEPPLTLFWRAEALSGKQGENCTLDKDKAPNQLLSVYSTEDIILYLISRIALTLYPLSKTHGCEGG